MQDRLRNCGPELTVKPLEAVTPAAKKASGKVQRDGGDRHDQDGRKIFLKTGVVVQARGSAYIEMGGTKVVVACYGPHETTRSREFNASGILECEFKFASFSGPVRRSHQQDDEEKELSILLSNTLAHALRLDLYPKSSIELFVTVLQDDGAALAAAITASSVALAAGGLQMLDLTAAASVVRQGRRLLTDPSRAEELERDAIVTVAYMPACDEVTGLVQQGEFSSKEQTLALEACVSRCTQVHQVQIASLRAVLNAADT